MTHIPIDKSNLPRVNEVCRDFAVLEDGALAHCLQEQEIEQHYASNVRKNKLVQKDIRIAKRLQDEEDQQSKVFSLEQQKQIEELDSEYARAVQEELRRKAQECLQREEEDKAIAKRLQQLEEEELQRKAQDSLQGGEETRPGFDIDPLDWKMAELHVQSSDQLLRDEELARRLQEEEEKRVAKLKRHAQHEDFRAAQVAQDEEIAKYIQRQELRANRRSEDLDMPGDSDDDGSIGSFSDRRSLGTKNEVPSSNQGRLDSEGLASPTECRTPEKVEFSSLEGSLDQAKLQSPRNIAEELDPTFKKEPQPEVFTVCSQSVPEFPVTSQTQPVPVDGLYDFMDDGADPIFIPPTKRQAEKVGRNKPKDKKEGCKQQ
ncbi:coiled-coil domain-containing protein 50-like isoform X2 [Hyperolius riggenbachi]|uniref:coiled-coil domain-containing protein 50-like isoform X2 n=1 Tax=Hyperolius riggenbachi TaxID=752182 RepID=UPI0035A2FC81